MIRRHRQRVTCFSNQRTDLIWCANYNEARNDDENVCSVPQATWVEGRDYKRLHCEARTALKDGAAPVYLYGAVLSRSEVLLLNQARVGPDLTYVRVWICGSDCEANGV